jgi:hypothetical protein
MSDGACFYFGCWGGTGHYLFTSDGRQASHQEGLDGPYLPICPRGCPRYCSDMDRCQPQGLARLTVEARRTVLDIWDRTVDSRGGSHSLFILPPGLDFAQAVQAARRHFPQIWARLDAAGVVVREAGSDRPVRPGR